MKAVKYRFKWFIIFVMLIRMSMSLSSAQEHQDVTVSQRNGRDLSTCGVLPSLPCKTISMGVWRAANHARVYVDGTGSEVAPYTCKSSSLPFPGIYSNKSVGIIGVQSTVHVKCQEESGIRFDKFHQVDTSISLTNIKFINSSVEAHDISLEIEGCVFTDVQQAINIQSASNGTISFARSTCENTSTCMAVTITLPEPSTNHVNIMITDSNIVRSWWKEPYNSLEQASGIHVTSIGEHEQRKISCHVVLENVTFRHNTVWKHGLVYMNLKNASTSLILDKMVFQGSKIQAHNTSLITIQGSFYHLMKIDNTRFLPSDQGSHSTVVIDSVDTIALSISNSTFANHTLANTYGVLHLKSDQEITVYIVNTTFIGIDGSMSAIGGCLSIFSRRATVHIDNSIFDNNSAAKSAALLMLIVDELVQFSIRGSCFHSNKAQEVGIAQIKGQDVVAEVINCTFDSTFVENNLSFFLIGKVHPWSLKTSNTVQLIMQEITIRNSGGVKGAFAVVAAETRANITIQDITMYTGMGSAFVFDGSSETLINIKNITIKKYLIYGPSLYFSSMGRKYSSLTLMMENSVFESISPGGCMYLFTTLGNVVLRNVIFKHCINLIFQAGVLYITLTKGNVSIESCQFTDNAQGDNIGGAISFFQFSYDTVVKRGCLHTSDIHRTWKYNTVMSIKDSIFVNNTALNGGALSLSKGNHTIERCFFRNNFAQERGGHIFVDSDSTSLTIIDSNFTQNYSKFTVHVEAYQKKRYKYGLADGVFISSRSLGPLIIINSALEASTTMDRELRPCVSITNGNYIHLNNETEIKCTRGKQLNVLKIPFRINMKTQSDDCMLALTSIQFTCRQCPIDTYSLQHGRSLGMNEVSGFHCLTCPFGAECHPNIVARLNFWGYIVKENPTELNFTLCPVGYCKTPDKADLLDINSCQGNRRGILCGQCKENYSETLLSASCCHKDHCNGTWLWFVVVVMATLMALYLIHKPKLLRIIIREMLWFWRAKNEVEDNILQNSKDAFNNDCGGYLKIVFYFYQIANLLLVNTLYNNVIESNIVHPVVGFFNFQYRVSSNGCLCPFPGLNAVSKRFLFASKVFGVLLMITVCYFIHWLLRNCKSKPPPSKGRYLGAILETLLLGYMVFATTSLQLLWCKSIGHEKLRLFVSGDVVCYQWWQYVLMGFVGVVIFPFIVTLALGSRWLKNDAISVKEFLLGCVIPLPYLVYKLISCLRVTLDCRTKLQHESRRETRSDDHQDDQCDEQRHGPQSELQHDPRYDSRSDPRYDSRSDPRYDSRSDPRNNQRHEVTQSDQQHDTRSDIEQATQHVPRNEQRHEPRNVIQSDQQHDTRSDSEHATQHVPRNDQRCSSQSEPSDWKLSVTGVLYGPFNGTSIYWESVLIFRRLLLILIHVFVEDPLFKELLLGLACVVILNHHTVIRPFHATAANNAETVSLFTLVVIATINSFKASFLSTGQTPKGPLVPLVKVLDKVQIALLAVLPVICILVVVAAILSQTVRLIFRMYRFVSRNRSREYYRIEGNVVSQGLLQPIGNEE